MKKAAIATLLCISLMFAAFVGGFYLGRNHRRDHIYVESILLPSTPAATSSLPPAIPSSITSHTIAQTQPTESALININTANMELLDTLPGIGPVTAQAIIDYREEYGPFERPEDLLNVTGIGEKKLADIIDYITTGG